MATIDAREFHEHAAPLIGLPVSHAWRGHGTAIFLELGNLTASRGNNSSGQATVMLEWSWRVEGARSIAFGSSSSPRKIEAGLQSLLGRRVELIEAGGRLPEIVLGLSGGRWVCSFATAEGQPEWALLLGNGYYLGVKRGAFFHGES